MTKPLSHLQVAAIYIASAVVIVLTLATVKPSTTAFGWYFCISFWALLGFDMLTTHAADGERFSFVDRVIGYLFAAPFIWPARLLTLMLTRNSLAHVART